MKKVLWNWPLVTNTLAYLPPSLTTKKSFIALALKKPEVAEQQQQETEDIDDENNNPGTDFNASNY
jgi:hypothetical protein